MPNPIYVNCPEGEWTPVAIAVRNGVVHVQKSDAEYYETYKVTGDPVPTSKAEGVRMFPAGGIISCSEKCDIYIWCTGSSGKVRVDL